MNRAGRGDAILLVDDDATVRASVGEMLKRCGYAVYSADNGVSAVELLQGGSVIDLVIADYRMPGMDGLTLARCIKEKSPGMPVIILTGNSDLESYLCASDLGVVRYIKKPVGLRDLLHAVTLAITGQQPRA